MTRMDRNIDLDNVARRLSFSLASPPESPSRAAPPTRKQPTLSPIAEDPREQQAAGTPSTSSPWASRPPSKAPRSRSVTFRRPVMTRAPFVVNTQIVPVSPGPLLSPFQPREAIAVAAPGIQQVWASALGEQQVWAAAGGQPQNVRLYTVEGNAAGYKTKWEELHPASQELLLQIEEKAREYMHQSKQLDQCSRLYDPSVSNKSFELYASHTSQEIGSISTIMDREKASIQNLMAAIKEIMCHTDYAVHSYTLRQRFIHRGAEIAKASCGNPDGSSGAPSDLNQPMTVAPTYRCYRGDIRRPSLFLQQIVGRFENQLDECCRMIKELELFVQTKTSKKNPDALESLPKVMSDMHDYFIHVAAKVENLHQYAQIIRTQYLNDRWNMGDRNDPFLKADKKDAAKQEATDRNRQFSSRCKNT